MSRLCRWDNKPFKPTERMQHYCTIEHKIKALKFIMWPEAPAAEQLEDLA